MSENTVHAAAGEERGGESRPTLEQYLLVPFCTEQPQHPTGIALSDMSEESLRLPCSNGGVRRRGPATDDTYRTM